MGTLIESISIKMLAVVVVRLIVVSYQVGDPEFVSQSTQVFVKFDILFSISTYRQTNADR